MESQNKNTAKFRPNPSIRLMDQFHEAFAIIIMSIASNRPIASGYSATFIIFLGETHPVAVPATFRSQVAIYERSFVKPHVGQWSYHGGTQFLTGLEIGQQSRSDPPSTDPHNEQSLLHTNRMFLTAAHSTEVRREQIFGQIDVHIRQAENTPRREGVLSA